MIRHDVRFVDYFRYKAALDSIHSLEDIRKSLPDPRIMLGYEVKQAIDNLNTQLASLPALVQIFIMAIPEVVKNIKHQVKGFERRSVEAIEYDLFSQDVYTEVLGQIDISDGGPFHQWLDDFLISMWINGFKGAGREDVVKALEIIRHEGL